MKRRLLCCSGLYLLLYCSALTPVSDASTPHKEVLPLNGHVEVTVDSPSVLLSHRVKNALYEQPDTLKLVVEDISFTCQQGCCGHFYDHCDLHIHYNAHLKEGMHLPVTTAITCDGIIEYTTESGDLLMNESEPVTVRRTLLTERRDDAYVSLDFPFSYYEEVVEAQLTSVKCRIDREESSSMMAGDK